MNLRALFLMMLLSITPCFSQEEPEKRPTPSRNAPRIVLVVDVSGSMVGEKLAEAIKSAGNIAIGPAEETLVRVFTFTDVSTLLIGPEKGWFLMPYDAKLLLSKLASLKADGMTNPNAALQGAFRSEHAQSVVLITDGIFTSGKNPVTTIQAEQFRIRKGGKTPPIFVIMGVQCAKSTIISLGKLAQATGGHFWSKSPFAEPEKDDIAPYQSLRGPF